MQSKGIRSYSSRSMIERLVKMAMKLATNEGVTSKQLMREGEVSWTTTVRDRAFLQERLGMAIKKSPDNIVRYRFADCPAAKRMIDLLQTMTAGGAK